LRHEGRQLDAGARATLERSIGASFGDVIVHSGAASSATADRAHAAAFTLGRHVVFGPGGYEPTSLRGRMLLAHELAHVVQQRRGGNVEAAETLPASALTSSSGGGQEHSAGVTAAQAALGMSAPVAGTAPIGVARKDKDEERSWREELWAKSKKQLQATALATMGAVEGIALEAGQIVDTVAWVESKAVDAGDFYIDAAGKKLGLSDGTLNTIKSFNDPGFKAMREQARKLGMVDPDTGAPILSDKLTKWGDAGEKGINEFFGESLDGDNFFTIRDVSQLLGALGSQVALAFVGAEEVQLLLKGVSGVGVMKAIADAVEKNPADFVSDRKFWTAVANAVLHFAGLKAASAGKKVVTLIVDVIGVLLSTGSELVQLREDYLKPPSEERTKALRKDVQGLIKAVVAAVRQAITHHQSLKKAPGGHVVDESAPKNQSTPPKEDTPSAPSSTPKAPPPRSAPPTTATPPEKSGSTGKPPAAGRPALPELGPKVAPKPAASPEATFDLPDESQWRALGELQTGGASGPAGQPVTHDVAGPGTPKPASLKPASEPGPPAVKALAKAPVKPPAVEEETATGPKPATEKASAPATDQASVAPTSGTLAKGSPVVTTKQAAVAKKAATKRVKIAVGKRDLADEGLRDAKRDLRAAEKDARAARKASEAATQAHADAPYGQRTAAGKKARAAKSRLSAAEKRLVTAEDAVKDARQETVRTRGNLREAKTLLGQVGKPMKGGSTTKPLSNNQTSGLPPGWDHTAHPRGPNRRWRPGDPVDMPSPSGGKPRWDTIRKRVWRTMATNELEARRNGNARRVTKGEPNLIDPTRELSKNELKAVAKNGKMPARVEAEIEHERIPQRVGRWLEAVGVGKNKARVLSGLGDSSNLLPTNKALHAAFDSAARKINPNRNRTLEISLDDRLESPLKSATPSEVAAIVESLKQPGVNLDTPAGKELRDALTKYKAEREGPNRTGKDTPWEVP
jgi:hypothetical protein